MIASPFDQHVLFHVGPVPVVTAVVTTWAIMIALVAGSWLATKRLADRPSRTQAGLELVIETIQNQIGDTIGSDPAPYLPLVGTLFLFLLTANWTSLIPGLEAPTATIETDAALALIVLGATIWFGVRGLGLIGYLRTFARPSLFMAPLNMVELLTRSLSLTVRLFGNIMSGMFIIGIVLSLAGLLVPIPLMALEVLIGAVQAYIFAMLATVFIAGALGDTSAPQNKEIST
ncbi:MAG: F0F1 ATP synthase subunit A [Candidatus Sphingomonas colombiensis]|nr:F0F1 ATP synthase subunit A [Sphingomonas sp.]WEK43236.1 MAG: F0F1 ATP synthase subunit A [Sphingomonas sp.]